MSVNMSLNSQRSNLCQYQKRINHLKVTQKCYMEILKHPLPRTHISWQRVTRPTLTFALQTTGHQHSSLSTLYVYKMTLFSPQEIFKITITHRRQQTETAAPHAVPCPTSHLNTTNMTRVTFDPQCPATDFNMSIVTTVPLTPQSP